MPRWSFQVSVYARLLDWSLWKCGAQVSSVRVIRLVLHCCRFLWIKFSIFRHWLNIFFKILSDFSFLFDRSIGLICLKRWHRQLQSENRRYPRKNCGAWWRNVQPKKFSPLLPSELIRSSFWWSFPYWILCSFRYDANGQLSCILCKFHVKNEASWTAHANGRQHHDVSFLHQSFNPSTKHAVYLELSQRNFAVCMFFQALAAAKPNPVPKAVPSPFPAKKSTEAPIFKVPESRQSEKRPNDPAVDSSLKKLRVTEQKFVSVLQVSYFLPSFCYEEFIDVSFVPDSTNQVTLWTHLLVSHQVWFNSEQSIYQFIYFDLIMFNNFFKQNKTGRIYTKLTLFIRVMH